MNYINNFFIIIIIILPGFISCSDNFKDSLSDEADMIEQQRGNVVAEFSADTSSGSAPLTVVFNDDSVGDIRSWEWDFGDGNTSSEKNPSNTFNDPGKYTVSLTVSGPNGSDTRSREEYITAFGSIVAAFSATPTTGRIPLGVDFTDLSEGLSEELITSWSWDFDNDAITDSTEKNPTYTFNTKGNYTITLIVSGPSGSDDEVKTSYINLYDPLVADFTANVTEGDAPLTVNFTSTSSGDIDSYAWDFNNDSTIDSTAQNPTHTFTEPGEYTVRLRVTDPVGSVSEIKSNYITAHPWHGIKTINSDVVEETEAVGGLAVSGSNVYIAYCHVVSAFERTYIRFADSTNGGENFTYTNLDDNPFHASGGNLKYPSLLLNGSNIYVSYLDYKNSGNDIITFIRSTNSGVDWGSPVSISTIATATPSDFSKPCMANYGASITITTYRGNSADLTYRRSYNSGASWYSENSFDTSTFSNLGAISIAMADSSTRYFTYDGYSAGPGWFTFSNGYGVYIGSSDYSDTYAVRDTNDGHDIYIARYSGGDLYCDISTTGGAGAYSPTWTAHMLDTTGDVGEYPSIVVDGSYVYISYYDATNTALKFIKSSNGGTSWSLPVTVEDSADVGKSSQIAVSGNHVYILYYDDTSNRVKLAKSVDRGDSW